MIDKKKFEDLEDLALGLLMQITHLEERVTELEKQMEETGAGVYYDHVADEYVKYINDGIAKARRGED